MTKPARILVADDDPDLRAVVETRLHNSGYEVVLAGDGCAALEAAVAESIDVAVLDIRMPRLDGFQLLSELNALDHPPHVIFLTVASEVADRVQGLFLGAVDYVGKPFDQEELLARVAVAVRERTRLEAAESTALTDPVTGIPNRLAFSHALAADVARAKRFEHPLSLVYVDVDGLKQVNDGDGHEAGDELLKAVARVLVTNARQIDSFARVGGDEFAVILPETEPVGATRFVDRVQEGLARESYLASGAERVPSCSIGIASYPDDGKEQGELCRVADSRLYEAKDARRQSDAQRRLQSPATRLE